LAFNDEIASLFKVGGIAAYAPDIDRFERSITLTGRSDGTFFPIDTKFDRAGIALYLKMEETASNT
jgi:hypothetical protein